jgi:hypothetical protein
MSTTAPALEAVVIEAAAGAIVLRRTDSYASAMGASAQQIP